MAKTPMEIMIDALNMNGLGHKVTDGGLTVEVVVAKKHPSSWDSNQRVIIEYDKPDGLPVLFFDTWPKKEDNCERKKI